VQRFFTIQAANPAAPSVPQPLGLAVRCPDFPEAPFLCQMQGVALGVSIPILSSPPASYVSLRSVPGRIPQEAKAGEGDPLVCQITQSTGRARFHPG